MPEERQKTRQNSKIARFEGVRLNDVRGEIEAILNWAGSLWAIQCEGELLNPQHFGRTTSRERSQRLLFSTCGCSNIR